MIAHDCSQICKNKEQYSFIFLQIGKKTISKLQLFDIFQLDIYFKMLAIPFYPTMAE